MKKSYRNQFQKNVEAYNIITQAKYIKFIYNLEKKVLDSIFLKLKMNKKRISVMDFACGSGRWTEYLETKFDDVLGIDVSKQMVDSAKKKCTKASFHVCDITCNNSNILNKKFDIITSFRFFKNAEEPLRKSALKNLSKYLKDDGILIFDLHLNTWSFNGVIAFFLRIFSLYKLFNMNYLTVKTISISDMKKLMKNSDFEIVEYYGTGLLPGRRNFTILPLLILNKVEGFITKNKILRNYCYNILVVAKKK